MENLYLYDFYFSLASSHSDYGSKRSSSRKRTHRVNENPSLSTNVDKTMSHIMTSGVR